MTPFASDTLDACRDCATRRSPWPRCWRSPRRRAPITAPDGVPVKTLGVVTVTGGRPTSLPTQIPTTIEGITREQIERTINATDSEDALKYFPSLLVRKRYIGDYNHAILSSRASGTGNSARSAVYADGILLSNYLGNGVGGLSFPPRWGLVTPEEIERVDVMYGPFSAAYPGNSVGAVVDYVTRMPTAFEAHAKVGLHAASRSSSTAPTTTYRAWQASASLGNRAGDWSWWLNVNHTDSEGQPLTFATRLVSAARPATAGTPVTGAVLDANNAEPALVRARHGHAVPTRSRTTPRSSSPTTSRRRCAPATCSASGSNNADGNVQFVPARRGRRSRSTAARSTSTAAQLRSLGRRRLRADARAACST